LFPAAAPPGIAVLTSSSTLPRRYAPEQGTGPDTVRRSAPRLTPNRESVTTMYKQKSSVDEIRQRFDNDVDRFSNIETGQTATIDAPLAMELITQAAFNSTKRIRRVLDIGCGAGNNTIKLSE
jgi:spermidine synthase